MTERATTNSILRILRARGAWAIKTHGAGATRSGIPDIIAVYRHHALALEVKQPGKHPTPLQTHELTRAAAAGATAAIVHSIHDVTTILDDIDQQTVRRP